jgi:hypothetical protein
MNNSNHKILSKGAQKLLDQLVEDYGGGLPADERKFDIKDGPKYIYNLFRGSYEFSYKQYEELYNYLIPITD